VLEFLTRHKTTMPEADQALPGRDAPILAPGDHAVLGTPIGPPFPADAEQIVVGMGCFWGAERLFWQLPGVHTTAVGYAGGHTPNPTYEEVCSGRTGQNEAVLVVFRPAAIALEDVLRAFWEGHDPTQGMRQGNDVGTQYRSGIYVATDAQRAAAEASRECYAQALRDAGRDGEITTEIVSAGSSAGQGAAGGFPFFYAEDYHQQYLAKVPNGYCGLSGTGVSCPAGAAS
jgi:peptide-methionine (S)-S-oxide reductase